MKPETRKIELYQYASKAVAFDALGPADALLGLDSGNYGALLQIRRTVASNAVLLELDSEDGGIILSDISPNLVLAFTYTALRALPTRNREQEWVYDLKVFVKTDRELTAQRVLEGPLIVYPGVTRRDLE